MMGWAYSLKVGDICADAVHAAALEEAYLMLQDCAACGDVIVLWLQAEAA